MDAQGVSLWAATILPLFPGYFCAFVSDNGDFDEARFGSPKEKGQENYGFGNC